MTHEQELAELLTLTVEVDPCGTTTYRNHLGQIHRVHGPAVILVSGYRPYRAWYQNDVLHREDGAAIEWDNGTKEWWLNGAQCTRQSRLV